MNNVSRSANYDQIARTYNSRYERNSYAGVQRALLEFIGTPGDQRILEVGCGTGHWLDFLQKYGLKPIGLDLSAGMLTQARRQLSSLPLIQGMAHQLPVASESFDRLFCINAIHHFADKPAFLKEARRILQPGGMLLIVGLDPLCEMDQWFVYDYFPESLEIDRQHYPAADALRAWMHEAGFGGSVTQEVEHWTYQLPIEEVQRQGRLEKASTSQLSVLTDAEYQRGMEKIHVNMESAKARGETLFLEADLRLYGTLGKAL